MVPTNLLSETKEQASATLGGVPERARTYSTAGMLPASGYYVVERLPSAVDAATTLMAVGVPVPLQVDEFGSALCSAGFGSLMTTVLYIVIVALFALGMMDVGKGFMNGRSQQSGRQAQSGGDFRNAGMKLIGIPIVAALPALLGAAGFTVIECVNVVPVFG